MPRYTGVWDAAGVAAYLDDARVPVRLACRTPDGPLWMLSLWYRRDGERLLCATSADADVVGYLDATDGVAFEVSTNDPPYRGGRENGSARVDSEGDVALLRDLFDRYLGGTDNDLADRLLREERDEVRIVVDPARLHSWDYTDRMADVSGR